MVPLLMFAGIPSGATIATGAGQQMGGDCLASVAWRVSTYCTESTGLCRRRVVLTTGVGLEG